MPSIHIHTSIHDIPRSIALALLAQFYPGSLQQNWYLVLVCVAGYIILSAVLTLFAQLKQRDAILVTKKGRVRCVTSHRSWTECFLEGNGPAAHLLGPAKILRELHHHHRSGAFRAPVRNV